MDLTLSNYELLTKGPFDEFFFFVGYGGNFRKSFKCGQAPRPTPGARPDNDQHTDGPRMGICGNLDISCK